MKKFILLIIILSFQITLSQEKIYFYLELSNLKIAPNVLEKNDGTKKIIFKDEKINEIFNKYIVYNFNRVAPNALSENLKKTFSIEFNKIGLMNEIIDKYPNIFIKTEQYTLPYNGGILFTPNDYNTYQPQTFYEPKHLDMINAELAWDLTTGNNDVKIGIADTGLLNTHEEFINKNVLILGSNTPSSHGTGVSGLAAGDTNNGVGFSSIGYNTGLIFTSGVGYIFPLLNLANNGAKVVNGSWYTGLNRNGGVLYQAEQDVIDDLYDMNVVVVIASGNGPESGGPLPSGTTINAENYASRYYYPASYKNVISVSTVGNWNDIGSTSIPFDHWKDVHRVKTPPNFNYSGTTIPINETEIFHQHNDSIDIVVPAYKVPVVGSWQNNGYWYSSDQGGISGTSFSAPIVTGTVGLMFSVNYCLKPKEIESILKLTARNIENLPENIEFHGRLGGGALDAFKAVEMADEMAKPFGEVVVEDRILYRNWFYKLETAPYEIKMQNNLVTEGAKIKFFARDNIEILSGDYLPTTGYVDLQINPNLVLDCATPFNKSSRNIDEKNTKEYISSFEVKLYPNPSKDSFIIDLGESKAIENKISIFDIFGKEVHTSSQNKSNFQIDISNLSTGIYIVKIENNYTSKILKFVKN